MNVHCTSIITLQGCLQSISLHWINTLRIPLRLNVLLNCKSSVLSTYEDSARPNNLGQETFIHNIVEKNYPFSKTWSWNFTLLFKHTQTIAVRKWLWLQYNFVICSQLYNPIKIDLDICRVNRMIMSNHFKQRTWAKT